MSFDKIGSGNILAVQAFYCFVQYLPLSVSTQCTISWDCKSFDNIDLISILELGTVNLYSLSDVGTDRMLGIDDSPRVS